MSFFVKIKNSIDIFFICIKSGFHGVYGWYKISQLSGPVITIFGGKAAQQHTKYTTLVYNIARFCIKEGMSVVTGGGPGIMEAANCGATEQAHEDKIEGVRTLGIGIHGIDRGYTNPCAPIIYMDTFFIRKWLFIRYAYAFIFLPGGIGTADELFEVLNLTITNQIKPVPIIIVGSDYWHYLLEWYREVGLAQKLIERAGAHLFVVADTADDVMHKIKEFYARNPSS